MPYCVVLECKNNSSTKNLTKGGISYHRFPKSPHVKEKWIEATGRQKWFPTKTSTICSEHFQENDFIIKKSGNKYLTATAIPCHKILQFQSDVSQNLPVPSSDYQMQPKYELNSDTETEASSPKGERVETCHRTGALTPQKKRLHGILRWKESTIKEQDLKIRKLRAQNRRLRVKITKIEDILKNLQEKICIDGENKKSKYHQCKDASKI